MVCLTVKLSLLCMDINPHCLDRWMNDVGFVTSWIKLKRESLPWIWGALALYDFIPQALASTCCIPRSSQTPPHYGHQSSTLTCKAPTVYQMFSDLTLKQPLWLHPHPMLPHSGVVSGAGRDPRSWTCSEKCDASYGVSPQSGTGLGRGYSVIFKS